jgi:hypothetical protein
MKLNTEVTELLLQNSIGHDGILYLLSIYFGLHVNCIPDAIQQKVNVLKIAERQYDGYDFHVKWNIPLFEGEAPTESYWDWVDDWRKLFKKVNAERDGTKRYCVARMKKFFSRFPEYRKEQVMAATKAYLSTVTDGQYCKKADKFIFEGSGVNEYSHLLEWCERMKDANKVINTFKKMGK